MFPDNNEITLYALKLSKDGHPRKIHAIKVLRSIAALSGAELLLRPGKALIDNIDNAPIVVDVHRQRARHRHDACQRVLRHGEAGDARDVPVQRVHVAGAGADAVVRLRAALLIG